MRIIRLSRKERKMAQDIKYSSSGRMKASKCRNRRKTFLKNQARQSLPKKLYPLRLTRLTGSCGKMEGKMSEIIKSYKGFNKDMTCRDKQYEEGTEYEEEHAEACDCGMHACAYPLDCFKYYPPGASVYHVVEQSGEISRHDEDSKIASTKMKIGDRLDIRGLVSAAIEYTKSRTTTEFTDPERATAGYCGAATAGYRGAATAGDRGAATAGDRGAATSRGSSASGENGLSVARGDNVRVKGGLGAILVIAEENELDYEIKHWKAVVVDGENIKADTWYKLEDGELVEVTE